MKVYGNYNVGFDDKNKGNGKVSSKDIKPAAYKQWVIYEALDKDESDWKFSLG